MNNDGKKLDILIKIGVGLILLSAFVFATTNWNSLTPVFKILSLIALCLIFYGLSFLTLHKLKLEKSSFMYYVVSTIMLIALIVAIGYYKFLGNWYSFNGNGSDILISNILLVCGILFFSYNKKKPNTSLEIIGLLFIYFSVFFVHLFFINKISIILFLLSVYLTLLSVIYKNKIKSYYLSNMKLLIYGVFFVLCVFNSTIEILCYLIILSYLYFNKNSNKNNVESFCFSLSYICAANSLLKVYCFDFKTIYLCFISLVLYIIGRKYIKNDGFINSSLLLHTFILMKGFYVSIINSENLFIYLLLILASASISYLYKNNKFEKILFIIKILLFIICLGSFIDIKNYIFSILLVLFAFLSYFSQDIYSKISYCIFNILIVIGVLLFNTFYIDISLYGLLPFMICFSLYLFKYKFNMNNFLLVSIVAFIYFFILFQLNYSYLSLCVKDDTGLSIVKFILFSIIISYIYKLFNEKNNCKILCLCFMTVPIFILCRNFDLQFEFEKMYILRIIISMYFFILTLFYKKIYNSSFLHFIFKILPLIILFTYGLSILTFVLWILCLVYIFKWYSNNENKIYGIFGIIVMFISVIINLFDFWSKIPLFVYLFICGIFVIIFVTKKEYNKNNSNNKIEVLAENNSEEKNDFKNVKAVEVKAVEELVENPINEEKVCQSCKEKYDGDYNFCPNCGNKIK